MLSGRPLELALISPTTPDAWALLLARVRGGTVAGRVPDTYSKKGGLAATPPHLSIHAGFGRRTVADRAECGGYLADKSELQAFGQLAGFAASVMQSCIFSMQACLHERAHACGLGLPHLERGRRVHPSVGQDSVGSASIALRCFSSSGLW